jgi:hypothetical protein
VRARAARHQRLPAIPRFNPHAAAARFDGDDATTGGQRVRKFIIERDLPAVGSLERDELRAAAAKSNEALSQLAPDVQWIESYVADDKTFCVYLASDEDMIRKHSEISGFPANRITEIRRSIDPTTAAI